MASTELVSNAGQVSTSDAGIIGGQASEPCSQQGVVSDEPYLTVHAVVSTVITAPLQCPAEPPSESSMMDTSAQTDQGCDETLDDSAAQSGSPGSGRKAARQRHQCTHCPKSFPRKRELITHVYIHKEKPKYDCAPCNKTFTTETQLRRHNNAHHKPRKQSRKLHVCTHCATVFRTSKALEKHHFAEHVSNKPFECHVCGAEFSWKENLVKHEQVHEINPHQCIKCDREFVDVTSLRVHMMNSHRPVNSASSPDGTSLNSSDKQFVCNICGRGFKFDFSYQAHLDAHIVPDGAGTPRVQEPQNVQSSFLLPRKATPVQPSVGDSSVGRRNKRTYLKVNKEAIIDLKGLEGGDDGRGGEAREIIVEIYNDGSGDMGENVSADGNATGIEPRQIVAAQRGATMTDRATTGRGDGMSSNHDEIQRNETNLAKEISSGEMQPSKFKPPLFSVQPSYKTEGGAAGLQGPTATASSAPPKKKRKGFWSSTDNDIPLYEEPPNEDEPVVGVSGEAQVSRVDRLTRDTGVSQVEKAAPRHSVVVNGVNQNRANALWPANDDRTLVAHPISAQNVVSESRPNSMLAQVRSPTYSNNRTSDDRASNQYIVGRRVNVSTDSKCKFPRVNPEYNYVPLSRPKKVVNARRPRQPFLFNCVMTSDKPFACSYCGESFRWEISLDIHTKIHTEGKVPKIRKAIVATVPGMQRNVPVPDGGVPPAVEVTKMAKQRQLIDGKRSAGKQRQSGEVLESIIVDKHQTSDDEDVQEENSFEKDEELGSTECIRPDVAVEDDGSDKLIAYLTSNYSVNDYDAAVQADKTAAAANFAAAKKAVLSVGTKKRGRPKKDMLAPCVPEAVLSDGTASNRDASQVESSSAPDSSLILTVQEENGTEAFSCGVVDSVLGSSSVVPVDGLSGVQVDGCTDPLSTDCVQMQNVVVVVEGWTSGQRLVADNLVLT